MEEEIDLKVYVRVLVRRWWLIAGLAFVAAAVAFSLSTFLPPYYQAEAMVAFTVPQYVATFDSRLQSLADPEFPYKAFPSLATSEAVLVALKDVVEERWPTYDNGLRTVAGLRRIVRANPGADPSLVILQVQNGDPQQVANLANAWAEVFVSEAKEIYGRSGDDLVYFEEQLDQAEEELDRAEKALVEFQRRNEGEVLAGQLEALKQAQTDYLNEQKDIEDMIRDVEGFLAQLKGYSADAPVLFGDDLTALFLEIAAFNADGRVPIELQIGGAEGFSDRSVRDVRTLLQGLSDTLQARLSAIESSLAAMEPQILDLQERIQGFRNELDKLVRIRNVAEDTYLILARKVEETRLVVEAPSGEVRLVSRASVPERPVGPRRLINAVVAGTIALMVGVLGVFAVEWWRGEGSESKSA
jgi:succinoglycan biosynthesis transport protein ExoP